MRLRFGECVFDPDTRQLVRAGQPVPVPPKVFELLDALIHERPRAVSKTDLHKRLWPDTVNVGGVRGGAPTGVVDKGAGGGQNTYNVDGVTISLGGVTYAHFDVDSLDSIGVTTGGSDPSLSSPGVTIRP